MFSRAGRSEVSGGQLSRKIDFQAMYTTRAHHKVALFFFLWPVTPSQHVQQIVKIGPRTAQPVSFVIPLGDMVVFKSPDKKPVATSSGGTAGSRISRAKCV